MVDVGGLRFVTEGQREALKSLQDYQSGLTRLSDLQDKHVATMNRALNERARAEQRASDLVMRARRGMEEAMQQEARAAELAAQEVARAQQMQARETEMLARAYNPLMAATSVYEREVQQLNRAHALGVLGADQLEAKLGELQVAYAQAGTSALAAQNFTNQFGSVTQIAGVKTNRFGMVAQQVGYQVGDFFVQIQSGTNAFVAFGQQATQLAGLLPGVIGAVVGIGISVSTMFLSMWSRSRQAADGVKTLDDAMSGLESALSSYVAAAQIALGSTTELRERFGQFADEVREAAEVLLQARMALVFDEARAAAQALQGEFATVTTAAERADEAFQRFMEAASLAEFDPTGMFVARDNAENLARVAADAAAQFGLIPEQVAQLDTVLAEFSAARTFAEMQESALAVVTTMESFVPEGEAMNAEMARVVDVVGQLVLNIAESRNEVEQATRAASGLGPGFFGAANAVDAMNVRLDGTLSRLGRILSAIGSIGFDIVAARAETAAMNAGMTRAQAQIEGQYAADIAGGPQSGLAGFANRLEAGAIRIARQELLAAEEQADATAAALFDVGSAAGSAGGAAEEMAESFASVTAEMEQALQRQIQLASVYGDERRALELTFELREKLTAADVSFTDEAVAGAVQRQMALENELKSLNDYEAKMTELADGLGDAFGDFFKSGFEDFEGFVDSVLDLFGNMLAEMVATAAAEEIKIAMGFGPQPGGGFAGLVGNVGSVFSGMGSPQTQAAAGGGTIGAVGSAVGTTAALGGLGGAIGALAGPIGIAIGLFSIFGQRSQKAKEEAQRVADEAYELETRMLELQGNTAELQRRQIDQLQEENQALGLQVQQMELQAAIDQEAESLQIRLAQATGDLNYLRQKELEAIDPLNAALLEQVWAAEDAAAAQARLLPLQMQLLEAQGRTEELRALQLQALSAEERALQKQIWAVQDAAVAADEMASAAQEAANAISPENFATLFEYQRALGLALNSQTPSGTRPDAPLPVSGGGGSTGGGTTSGMSQEAILLEEAVRVLKDFKEQSRLFDTDTVRNTKRTGDTLIKWDLDGIPGERV